MPEQTNFKRKIRIFFFFLSVLQICIFLKAPIIFQGRKNVLSKWIIFFFFSMILLEKLDPQIKKNQKRAYSQ